MKAVRNLQKLKTVKNTAIIDENHKSVMSAFKSLPESIMPASVLAHIFVHSVVPVTAKGKTMWGIRFHYKSYNHFIIPLKNKIQGELEKKLGVQVSLIAYGRTLPKTFARLPENRGMKTRPHSRTMAAVHEALLDQLIHPVELMSKQRIFSPNGDCKTKICLNKVDKLVMDMSERLPVIQALYQKLTGNNAIFCFN